MKQVNSPDLVISNRTARRFLLSHHRLWPPRKLRGRSGILDYVRHVNCIQYDPINLVGQNPHLLLQSRVRKYKTKMLDELLYKERSLLDGMDKVMSIYPMEDWPYFFEHRKHYADRTYPAEYTQQARNLRKDVLMEILSRGPLSPLDIDIEDKVDWFWGSTKAGRAGLEMLFLAGEIVVDHRIGTRRYFELSERLVPKELLQLSSPYKDRQEYRDWHVHRRVGGLGIAHPGAGEHWGGMLWTKSPERRKTLERLRNKGRIVQIAIEGLEDQAFFVRQSDMTALHKASKSRLQKGGAAIIAALDNLMWDRKLIGMLFGFDYVWEVYKPKAKRKFGYYVLPILYGDQFVARFEPGFDRKTGEFRVKNWWWEESAKKVDTNMQSALYECFQAFMDYLEADSIEIDLAAKNGKSIRFLLD